MPSHMPINDGENAAAFARKVAAAGDSAIVAKDGVGQFAAVDPGLSRGLRGGASEEHLERLLAKADRDIAAGNVSDMRADLEQMKEAYDL